MGFVAQIFEYASVFCFGGTTHIIPDNVQMDVLDKICVGLKCQLSDIAEISYDE